MIEWTDEDREAAVHAFVSASKDPVNGDIYAALDAALASALKREAGKVPQDEVEVALRVWCRITGDSEITLSAEDWADMRAVIAALDAHRAKHAKPAWWRVRLICCGRDDGYLHFATWEDADKFRDDYTRGPGVHPNGYSAPEHAPGHKRAAIIEALYAHPAPHVQRDAKPVACSCELGEGHPPWLRAAHAPLYVEVGLATKPENDDATE